MWKQAEENPVINNHIQDGYSLIFACPNTNTESKKVRGIALVNSSKILKVTLNFIAGNLWIANCVKPTFKRNS